MGKIKDRNSIDLTEVENIKKRCQEYTEELYKKDFHDPDNHCYKIGLNDPDNPDGVVTHPEPDILEC